MSQNFLINPKIAEYMVEVADLSEDDTVLEIGAGKGILTQKLLKKARVIAVEIDPSLCEYLHIKFEDYLKEGYLKLLCGDALKLRFPPFTKVAANIPYHISSPLIFKLFEYNFRVGVIMLQREFAERLCAKPGTKNYGRLSVMMYYNGDAEIIKYVKKGNFRPVPDVDSAIVKIIRKDRFCFPREIVEDIVRRIFSHRRKKIRNILGDVPYADYRAEELAPEQICEVIAHVYGRLRD